MSLSAASSAAIGFGIVAMKSTLIVSLLLVRISLVLLITVCRCHSVQSTTISTATDGAGSEHSSTISVESELFKLSIDSLKGAAGEADEEDDDEKTGRVKSQFNFASHAAGAIILDKSPASATGYSNLLNDDKDKYGISSCSEKKWVVIGLSEDILVTSVMLANYEKYSSKVKDFQLLASTSYPTDDWINLGKFESQAKLGEQYFNVSASSSSAHTRYLKFKFLTHYDNEALCTLSQIKVHGTTVIASFKQEVERSDSLMRDMLSQFNLESEDTTDNTTASSSNSDQSVQVEDGVSKAIEGGQSNISVDKKSDEQNNNNTAASDITHGNLDIDSEPHDFTILDNSNIDEHTTAATEVADVRTESASGSSSEYVMNNDVSAIISVETTGSVINESTAAGVLLPTLNHLDSNNLVIEESLNESIAVDETCTSCITNGDNANSICTSSHASEIEAVVSTLIDAEKDGANASTIDVFIQSIFPKETTISSFLANLTTLVTSAPATVEPAAISTVDTEVVVEMGDNPEFTVNALVDDPLIDSTCILDETVDILSTQHSVDDATLETELIVDKSDGKAHGMFSANSSALEVHLASAANDTHSDDLAINDSSTTVAQVVSTQGNSDGSTYDLLVGINSNNSHESYLSVSESENTVTSTATGKSVATVAVDDANITDISSNNSTAASDHELVQIDDLMTSARSLSKKLNKIGPKTTQGLHSINAQAAVSDVSCLELMKFSDFQSKMMSKLLNSSAGASSGSGSGDGASNALTINTQDNVFRHLMQKIKTLEMSYAIIELYNVQVNECYRTVIGELMNKTLLSLESSTAASVDASNSASAASVLLKIVEAKNNEKSIHLLNVFSLTEKEVIYLIPFLCLIVVCSVLFSIAVLALLYIHIKSSNQSYSI